MGDLSRLIIRFCAALFMMIFVGCTEQSSSPGSSGGPIVSDSEPNPDIDQDPELVNSFDDLLIEDGFIFDMQRTVNIDISFAQKQGFTEISIFSATDPITHTPTNLLEKAEIYNATKFNSSLSVPSYAESMVVVINGDSYAELELPIDKTNRIHYLVE